MLALVDMPRLQVTYYHVEKNLNIKVKYDMNVAVENHLVTKISYFTVTTFLSSQLYSVVCIDQYFLRWSLTLMVGPRFERSAVLQRQGALEINK